MTKTVLSVSGGKDSSAMLVKMCNEGIHIFIDDEDDSLCSCPLGGDGK